MTITPLVCDWLLPAAVPGESGGDPYKGFIFTMYRGMLKFCLRFRWATVVVMLGLFVLALWGFGFVPISFFPDSTRPQFMVHYWRPEGTHIDETEADVAKIVKWIRTQEGVTDVDAFVGRGAQRFLLTYTPEKDYTSYGLLMIWSQELQCHQSAHRRFACLPQGKFPGFRTEIREIHTWADKGRQDRGALYGPGSQGTEAPCRESQGNLPRGCGIRQYSR